MGTRVAQERIRTTTSSGLRQCLSQREISRISHRASIKRRNLRVVKVSINKNEAVNLSAITRTPLQSTPKASNLRPYSGKSAQQ